MNLLLEMLSKNILRTGNAEAMKGV